MAQISPLQTVHVLDVENMEPQIDQHQGTLPKVRRGSALEIYVLMIAENANVDDVANLTKMVLNVTPKEDPGSVFISKEVLVAAFEDPNGGSGSPPGHAKFTLTAAEMALALGGATSRIFNFVWKVETLGGDAITLGSSDYTVFDDGSSTALAVVGSSHPNFRMTNDGEFQLKNQDTGEWNTPWAKGADGAQHVGLTEGES